MIHRRLGGGLQPAGLYPSRPAVPTARSSSHSPERRFMRPLVTLTTDFGHGDWYVGAVRGVLLSALPDATLIDVTHEIGPGDIEGAAFQLAAAAPCFPPGTVHLAVVDPGVGSGRRELAVAAEILGADGRELSQLFVAPDNGLLEPILDAATVVSVERPDLRRPAPGVTFHGRDRFAPIAAALAGGEAIDALGPRINDPVRLHRPAPRRVGDGWIGRVIHIDRFV